MSTGWEDRAHGWLTWARTPGHDGYWRFRDAFFDLLPKPGSAVLEVGCGEGRVCRDLRERGYRVTGIDASPTLVAAAAAADPGGRYVVGTAEQLPFPDGSFDLVVSYNSLMDVADMPQTVAECARVLSCGGRLAASVTHPFADAGRFESEDADARFVVRGSYLDEGSYTMPVERAGLSFTFESRTYPLSSYAAALERAGLLIEAIREPASPGSRSSDERWRRMPVFLLFRALKP